MTDSIWTRALLAALGVLISGWLPAGCLLATTSGCSMLNEFGEPAAQYPGVRVQTPGLLTPGSLVFNANGKTSVESAEYHGPSPDGATGASLVIKNAEFNQDVSGPMKEAPAILRELPPMLATRVQITHEIVTAIPQSIEAVADAVSPIAAGAHAVREIFKSYNKEPTPEIADLLARIDALEQAAKDAKGTVPAEKTSPQ